MCIRDSTRYAISAGIIENSVQLTIV